METNHGRLGHPSGKAEEDRKNKEQQSVIAIPHVLHLPHRRGPSAAASIPQRMIVAPGGGALNDCTGGVGTAIGATGAASAGPGPPGGQQIGDELTTAARCANG